ncbi:phospholipase domain-containing protein [Streptomyces xanthochromogenes]|uniref:phospholipase domain-containing protein n=1 Tax=Streptomyces xanthochromogenes TaxID=67384 RepID=UPI00381DBE63
MRHAPKRRAARWAVSLAAVSTVVTTGAALPAKGPEPIVAAVDDCARGGVDVTARNGGDTPFTFQLAGVSASVAPGGSRTVLVPVADRQSYRFTVLGPGGFRQDVAGVLDCASPAPAPTAGADRAADADRAPAVRPAAPAPRESGAVAGGRRLAFAGVTDLDALITGAVLVLLGAMLLVVRRLAW